MSINYIRILSAANYAIGLTLDTHSNEFVWPATWNAARDLPWLTVTDEPGKGWKTATGFTWSEADGSFRLYDESPTWMYRAVCRLLSGCPPVRD